MEIPTTTKIQLGALAIDYMGKNLPLLIERLEIECPQVMLDYFIDSEAERFDEWYVGKLETIFDDETLHQIDENSNLTSGLLKILLDGYTNLVLLSIIEVSSKLQKGIK